jgi:rhamnosyltransferase
MTLPSASVVVRTHESRDHLNALLPLLRRQSVDAELIVVDSGSLDGSRELAARLSDRLVELEPGTYSPGKALNAGAEHASGEIVFALSAHCRPPDDRWIERSLAAYGRPDVAATNGSPCGPDGAPFDGVFFQAAEHARGHPDWGFSNHASSWRAAVWHKHRFDEELTTSEDRVWAIEVTAAGWLIAFDPTLWVQPEHRWKQGARSFMRRERRELIVIGSHAPLSPYTRPMLLSDWWQRIPEDRHSTAFHRFLNYRRAAGLLGKYLGHREARRIRR